jgi:hypothetical protein
MTDLRFIIYVTLGTIIAMMAISCLVGCTMSVTLANTQGKAQDLVNETQTPSTDLEASVPVTGIPAASLRF